MCFILLFLASVCAVFFRLQEIIPEMGIVGVSNLPGDLFFYDFDGNGLTDFMIFGSNGSLYDGRFFYYSQVSNGTYLDVTATAFSSPPLSSSAGRFDFADFDDNGLLDFAIICQAFPLRYFGIFSQYSPGIFTDITNSTTFGGSVPVPSIGSLKWFDFNQDGLMDLILPGITAGDYLWIYIQNGAGTFSRQPTSSYIFNSTNYQMRLDSIEVADYDNDGKLDFFILEKGYFSFRFELFHRESNGLLRAVDKSIVFPGFEGIFGSVVVVFNGWVDYDGDGLLDIFLNAPTTTGRFNLLRQNANGQFLPVADVFGSLQPTYARPLWSDLDGDGDLDLVLIGYQGSSGINRILTQNPDHTFSVQDNVYSYPDGIQNRFASLSSGISDFNNDGRPDILFSSVGNGEIFRAGFYVNGCPPGKYLNIYPNLCIDCEGDISEDQRECLPCLGQTIFNIGGCISCPDDTFPNLNHSSCLPCNGTVINSQCVQGSASQGNGDGDSNKSGNLILGLTLGLTLPLLLCCLCFFCLTALCLCCGIFLLIAVLLIVILIAALVVVASSASGFLIYRRHQKICYEDIEFEKELGAGAFGSVFLGKYKSRQVAIKSLTVYRDQKALDDFLNESSILEQLHHPNVIGYIGTVVGQDSSYLLLEFAPDGSLDRYFQKHQISIEEKLGFGWQIAQGLIYLHSRGIIHRDLACRNILVSGSTIKITDFGLSRLLPDPEMEGQKTKNNIGPVRWLPIEFLMFQEYSKPGDIYMFGMLLYEMLAEKYPYAELDVYEAMNCIRRGIRPKLEPEWPLKIQEMLTACWSDIPKDRPSLSEISAILSDYTAGGYDMSEETTE